MQDRYETSVERAIVFGRIEAVRSGSSTVKGGHLLLGLLRENKEIVGQFCSHVPLSTEAIGRETAALCSRDPNTSNPPDMPLDQEATRILGWATEEAGRLGSPRVKLEHVLMGILRDERNIAADVLHNHGLRLAKVREKYKDAATRPNDLIRGDQTQTAQPL